MESRLEGTGKKRRFTGKVGAERQWYRTVLPFNG